MKKLVKLFFSMKFALILLLILAAACVAGSVIPQGNSMAYYTENYSTQISGAIMLFGLDDVFHCTWFVILTVILCANLIGCNLLHFPALLRRTREGFTAEKSLKNWNKQPVTVTADPKALFAKTGFRRLQECRDEEGRSCLYSVKNKAGIWGAWLTHLGMLIIIIGFGMGQVKKVEYTVYGIPGETKPVGDTTYELTIDQFETILREDDTVEQYTSLLTLTNTADGSSAQGETHVNGPCTLFGMKLYQNSTGWAGELVVRKNGKEVKRQVLCVGEYAHIDDDFPDVSITLAAFYPDYGLTAEGMPVTKSGRLNNPGYLYRLYYKNEMLGMNVLTGEDKITLEDYEIEFIDPKQYTLIQIKRDPFTKVAALGGLVIMIALILAFYLRTAEVWAVEVSEGVWAVAGKSRKGGEEFLEQLSAGNGVPAKAPVQMQEDLSVEDNAQCNVSEGEKE